VELTVLRRYKQRSTSWVRVLSGLLARPQVRAAVVALLCLAGATTYVMVVKEIYPPGQWLFWRLLALWSWCLLFNGACLSFGHLVLARCLRVRDLPVLETLATSVAVGVVAFTLMMYLLGALALFRPAVAVVLPVAMLAAGLPELSRFVRHSWPRPPGSDSSARRQFDPLGAAVIAYGVLCLGLLYLQCLTPEATSYDARWYHLPIAEEYARAGRIVSFPADYPRCYPHLASLIYTWGFLVPGLSPPLRWMMALHSEYCLFLWTLVGVAAGVAWLVEKTRVKGAWVAFFLFPGIFVYDAHIGAGADHVAAFFAMPIILAALRAARDLSPRQCALVGVLAAGALLTRYQAMYLFVPVALLLGVSWVRLSLVGGVDEKSVDRARLWRGPALLLAVGALLSAPHFLKNWIYYRNPVYPFLMDVFKGSRPFPDVPQQISDNNWRPHGTFWVKVGNAIATTFTFTFRPHYAPQTPVMGSLFTLLLPAMAFVRQRRRVLTVALMGLAAILTWASTYLIDRQAQIFIPVLASVTGAAIFGIWQMGAVARAGLIALVGLQIVWGGDALFFSEPQRIIDALEMIRTGYEKRADTRFDKFMGTQVELSRRLPPDAVVLFHNTRLSLGVGRKVLQDMAGFQALISYRGIETPRQLYDLYRSHGITHIVHERGVAPALSKEEEVMFLFLIDRCGANRFQVGGFEVVELPSTPPPDHAPFRVLALGLGSYPDGVYPIRQLGVVEIIFDPNRVFPAAAQLPTNSPAVAESPIVLIDGVDAVIIGKGAQPPPGLDGPLRDQFQEEMAYDGKFTVYLRR